MKDENEASLLRAIAEEGDDNAGRLVFADWLEEHGDADRAEFVRVQCELAAADVAEKRRMALRVRERDLLNLHRRQWLQAYNLPIEDVGFARGLIASMRLSKWDDGRMLETKHLAHLGTLTELDLSGLGIGDEGLTAFARTVRLPALRKLILNGNKITDAGATVLADATGLPRLDTVYLFQNSVSEQAGATLEASAQFTLANLDVGERPDGYMMSPGEAEMARRLFVRAQLLPLVTSYFHSYERLQSAVLCVAQYWNDEANDAVHGELVVSELFEPNLQIRSYSDEPDPNVPNTRIKQKYSETSSAISLWDAQIAWHDNDGAIPLWAAYAPEGGSQEYDYLKDVYLPAVMFYRHGGFEFLPMNRPHLDGIRPEWEGEQ